ncbi:hypothetical protein ATANTOWER_013568 [Ataeniobius toweri]|uniref:GDNF/GAS1 domain-containing protein n=1 Tax=Ataeniobius toweri TaxID=208326 RepID=A0ABU7BYF4_9TELE|nr:hypothetical protein [Ataeniobius toweri]
MKQAGGEIIYDLATLKAGANWHEKCLLSLWLEGGIDRMTDGREREPSGAEFYLLGGAGTAGPSSIRGCGRQKTSCRREPGYPGARLGVKACHGGRRCFCGNQRLSAHGMSLFFHKNSGNSRGRLLRPVWHLLASSRNPLAPSGMLSSGRQRYASAGLSHELSSALLSQRRPTDKTPPPHLNIPSKKSENKHQSSAPSFQLTPEQLDEERPPDGPSPNWVWALSVHAVCVLMYVCLHEFLRDDAICLECNGSSADALLTLGAQLSTCAVLYEGTLAYGEPAVARENNCLTAAKACNLNDTCKKYRSAYISPCTSRVSTAEICNKRKCHKALRQFFDKARRL